jgi:VWFA-related protein
MRFYLRIRHCYARPAAHVACLALVAFSVQIAAQNPTLKTRTKEQREREYQASHRITLNVQVADPTGKLVPDLAAADFALLDNNQPRKIAGFHLVDGQLMNDATEILILLDAVNSTAQQLQTEREAIFKYLAQGHGQLAYPTAFVLWFNGHLKSTAPTTDRNQVGRSFVSMTKGLHSNACSPGNEPDGSVALASASADPPAAGGGDRDSGVAHCLQVHFKDSVAALDGIAQQQKTVGGRTILIWVGPSWPLLSDAEFQRLTPREQAGFFDEIVDLHHHLRDAQVTVDAVAPADVTGEKEPVSIDVKTQIAGGSARNSGPAGLALPVLARQSGGRALTASRDLTTDLASCLRDADGYYAISFEAMTATAPHELHRLEVRINRPNVEVRTLSVYYAEP